MKVRADKLVGYALLAVGLAVTLFAVRSMYDVYTGAGSPPPVIGVGDVKVKLPAPAGAGQPREEILLISGGQASKLMNMGLWWILMGFVASVGARIGGLGIGLAREIKVEVKGRGTSGRNCGL